MNRFRIYESAEREHSGLLLIAVTPCHSSMLNDVGMLCVADACGIDFC